MSILDSAIQELLVLEPFWKICYPCRFHGFCCIGARVTFYGDENAKAQEYIRNLPLKDQQTILENERLSLHCIYRASDRCLIHEVRPENCRFTPFQAAISPGNVLTYSMVRVGASGHCEFQMRHVQLSEQKAARLRAQQFLPLANFDRVTFYLSLNWLLDQKRNHN